MFYAKCVCYLIWSFCSSLLSNDICLHTYLRKLNTLLILFKQYMLNIWVKEMSDKWVAHTYYSINSFTWFFTLIENMYLVKSGTWIKSGIFQIVIQLGFYCILAFRFYFCSWDRYMIMTHKISRYLKASQVKIKDSEVNLWLKWGYL